MSRVASQAAASQRAANTHAKALLGSLPCSTPTVPVRQTIPSIANCITVPHVDASINHQIENRDMYHDQSPSAPHAHTHLCGDARLKQLDGRPTKLVLDGGVGASGEQQPDHRLGLGRR